ncbi:MAG TPA: hypothetical protein VHH34_00005, partial [Pseudonocardiaceae bacterium]|nr:hypothetical protein [Pseudonocardiaceae bacterium]
MNAPRRDDEQDKGGQVVPFPGAAQVPDVSQGGEVEPAPEVFEAELVDEQDDTQRAAVQRYVPPPLVVVQRVVVVVRPRTTNAGKATLRAGVTIAQGFGSWVGRAWDEMTLGVYRRAIEAAEAAGDHDRLVDWTTRHQQVKDKRHQRMLNAPKLVVGGGIIAGICLLGLVVLVVLAGLVVQLTGAGTFLGVMHGALDGIRWVIAAVPVAAGVLLVAGPPAVLAAAWREGKRRGSVPTWLAAPRGDGDVMDQLPDEGTIVNALNNLGIPGFTKAIKGGWRLHFAMPPVMD